SNVTSGSPTLTIGTNAGSNGGIDDTFGGDATFNVTNNGAIPMTVIIAGPIGQTTTAVAGLNKTGNGTLILQGAGTFTGITTATGGVLRLSNANALSMSDVAISSNFVYDPALTPFVFGGLTGSSNATPTDSSAGAIALNVGNNGHNVTYSGSLSGSVSINKIGSGTQTFAANNTYSGSTTVTAGPLETATTPTGTRTLKTGALTTPGGRLDIQDNKVITTSAGGISTSATYAGGHVIDGVTGLSQY